MKSLRVIALVLAVSCWSAALAHAGDCSSASAAKGGDACCGAHSTSGASATAASTGNAHGACPMSASQCTAAMKAQCTAAMRAQCARGAAMTKAGSGCPFHAATLAMNNGRCDMKGVMAHDDCAVCADEAVCLDELRATGARSQVVSLRNGSMIVYTADSPGGVRALQASMRNHNETIMRALAAGSDASLCDECKAFRGAMASGKFSREVVNVKNGCQILLTSSDRNIVHRIHDMTGALALARTKS